uniref:Uncharacterized protein n=1 Tax=Arundo donax TaxID=35708 RepID=A0A0A9DYK4_ARUDO
MEYANLQRQATSLKKSLFDQACVLFFSNRHVLFVQEVFQYCYQYILCTMGETHILRQHNSTSQYFSSIHVLFVQEVLKYCYQYIPFTMRVLHDMFYSTFRKE